MKSFSKSTKLDKKYIKSNKDTLNKEDFKALDRFIKECNIDSYGYSVVEAKHIFKGMGIPYKYAIILSAKQDKEPILTSPSMESQMEVMRIYGVTGVAANKISEFLIKRGYAAAPGHSLGGSVDYCLLAEDAGMGAIGKHGMTITPECGGNHRISVVFTNISNLDEFIVMDREHAWIKEFCKKCSKCMRQCPGQAIHNELEWDKHGNGIAIDYFKCIGHFGEKHGCNVCIKECPFTTIDYYKLKEKFKGE